MKRYGYVRVSAKDQNPERQLLAMREQEIEQKNVYVDKMSGKSFERPQYRRLLKRLQRSDVLVVKSIDRLGRNYQEILEQWRHITKEIGADIQVLDMPLLNTNATHGDLTGVFVADLVLQILAYVAETEREFIRHRQAEGIAAARLQGVKFGPKMKEVPEAFEQCYKLWRSGEMSIKDAAKAAGMSGSTFYRRSLEKEGKTVKR